MNLGRLIARLEAIPDKSREVRWGFSHPHTSRGSYSEVAFDPAENVTIQSMLDFARSALGSTFEGWKGGDYTMDENTECWIEEFGDWDENGISDQLVNYWERDARA